MIVNKEGVDIDQKQQQQQQQQLQEHNNDAVSDIGPTCLSRGF
jgi:hypothetical protein